MLSTSETTTTGMFPVFPDTTVPGRYVAAMLTGLAKVGRHSCIQRERESELESGSGAKSRESESKSTQRFRARFREGIVVDISGAADGLAGLESGVG